MDQKTERKRKKKKKTNKSGQRGAWSETAIGQENESKGQETKKRSGGRKEERLGERWGYQIRKQRVQRACATRH